HPDDVVGADARADPGVLLGGREQLVVVVGGAAELRVGELEQIVVAELGHLGAAVVRLVEDGAPAPAAGGPRSGRLLVERGEAGAWQRGGGGDRRHGRVECKRSARQRRRSGARELPARGRGGARSVGHATRSTRRGASPTSALRTTGPGSLSAGVIEPVASSRERCARRGG